MIERAQAHEDSVNLFGEQEKSNFNSFYKEDGSLVNIYGAEESGKRL